MNEPSRRKRAIIRDRRRGHAEDVIWENHGRTGVPWAMYRRALLRTANLVHAIFQGAHR